MKPIVCILIGHHGKGTGASDVDSDEWQLSAADAEALYFRLLEDGYVVPIIEPIEQDSNVDEKNPRERAAAWAKAQNANVVLELHYNSFETTTPEGHLVTTNAPSSFANIMSLALGALPNSSRGVLIQENLEIPKRLAPTPCILLEPAFIFEAVVDTITWRPMLVNAIVSGIYKYFHIVAKTTLEPMPNPVDRPFEDRDLTKPYLTKVGVPTCPATKATFWDKLWVGTKHFTYGFLVAAGTAAATDSPWQQILLLAIGGGAALAFRKTAKDAAVEQGKEWPDLLDKLLELIILLVKLWRNSKKK